MTIVSLAMTAGWTDQQRAFFQAQMSAWQKDEVVGVLLALFLGTFGAHHFYLRRPGLGILYIVFCWTGIPTIVSIVECFFMPGRVRQYNLALATYFASQLTTPAATAPIQICSACGAPIPEGSNFCGRCGAKTAG
jgi:TM2 domain-containing membrane protein YozV